MEEPKEPEAQIMEGGDSSESPDEVDRSNEVPAEAAEEPAEIQPTDESDPEAVEENLPTNDSDADAAAQVEASSKAEEQPAGSESKDLSIATAESDEPEAESDGDSVEAELGLSDQEDKAGNATETQDPTDDQAVDEAPPETADEDQDTEDQSIDLESELAPEAESVTEEVQASDEAKQALEATNGSENVVAETVSPDQELAEAAEPQHVAEPDDGRLWYVVHCYSGYENKVRHNLEQRIETMNMKGKIFDVVVPTEEEMEVKEGKRRTVERRVFPGYILVQMIMDEDSWYVVRNTPGVTGFVGMGNDPTPLRPEEVSQIVKRMEAEAPRIKVTYKIGQKVRIIDGPFNDFIGTVDDIDMDRAKVRVMVSFFGRETPVELDFLQVEKA